MRLVHKHRSLLGVMLILAVIIGIIAGSHYRSRHNPVFVEYAMFIEAVNEGQIEKVVLGQGAELSFYFVDNANTYTTNNPRRDGFKEYLLLQGVAVTEINPSTVGIP